MVPMRWYHWARDMISVVARCARMGPSGEWVITFDEPHDREDWSRSFLSDVWEAMHREHDRREFKL